MKSHDLVGGLVWIGLGIYLCIGSIKLGLGELHNPGPGFVPFLSAAILGLWGAILMTFAILKKLDGGEKSNDKRTWVKENWKGFVSTLAALFGYGILLDRLGFLITTFGFLFFLFKITDPKGWKIPLMVSGLTTILSYLLFSVWLQGAFPKGIFRF